MSEIRAKYDEEFKMNTAVKNVRVKRRSSAVGAE